jgi:eukaryotic-like serine/threonine-protein kinase
MVREGDTLAGRYRLTAQLGCGGMSEVWLAEDLELDRRVAVKLLSATADRLRLEREARAYAACSDSNVACVYDYGEAENRPFIVLEYLPGGTLEDRFTAEEPLPDVDTTRIAAEIAAGMAHAHSRGLVHRDLKPANILFDAEGRVKIADFGIAHATDASTLTEAGTILGTAAYASPEQARGQPVTPASDVYSFGVILFRMLTGRLPFAATNTMELLVQHAQEEAPDVRRFRPDAPPHLAALTSFALAKDPQRRPKDGDELLASLTSPGEATAETARTHVLTPPARRPRRRAAIASAAALTLLVPVGFAAAVLSFGGNTSEPTPAPAGTRDKPRQGTGKSTFEPATSSSSTATTTTRPRPTTAETTEPERPTSTTRATPGDESTPSTTSPTTTTTSTDTTTTDTTGTTTPAP